MNENIGKKIKALRKSKKFTLKEIADQTGLSISFLSQVERLKSSLTLESLKKISEALQVNPSYFFSEEQQQSKSIITRDSEFETQKMLSQFIYKDLSSSHTKLNFSPILVVLNPGENEGNPFSHSGVEFLYVLEGTLSVLLDDEELHLHAHDSIVIDAIQPHYWLNHTDSPVKFLCISSDD